MHEIIVISGKGGTGKTSITAALAQIAGSTVICDLDVDAPDLHLLLSPAHQRSEEFWSGHVAQIQPEVCTLCGTCVDLCRFDAIELGGGQPVIRPLKCEGCKVCVALCPSGAIAFNPKHCGNWYISDTRFGPMVHAQLFPAEENSGRLVALLRKEARELAESRGLDMILSDGPPGIGCPVISSLSGTTLAVIVTEPTPSGEHDLQRVISLCEHFKVRMAVMVNKWDLSPEMTAHIEKVCERKAIPVIGKLPHDPAFTLSMVQAKTIMEYGSPELGRLLQESWERVVHTLKTKNQMRPSAASCAT